MNTTRFALPASAIKYLLLAACIPGFLVYRFTSDKLGCSTGLAMGLGIFVTAGCISPALFGRTGEALRTFWAWRRAARARLSVQYKLGLFVLSALVWVGLLVRGWHMADAALLAFATGEFGSLTFAHAVVSFGHQFTARMRERHYDHLTAAQMRHAEGTAHVPHRYRAYCRVIRHELGGPAATDSSPYLPALDDEVIEVDLESDVER